MPRQRQEWTLALDASEFAWSGVLDGLVDPHAWPWDAFCERSGDLFRCRHAAEHLALEAASVDVVAPDRVEVRLTFRVLDSYRPGRSGAV
jgi:hypothetical protein